MAQGHRVFSGFLDEILGSVVVLLLVVGWAITTGGVIGVVLGVGYLAAVLYREFHKEDPDIESGGNIHQFFSQKTHDLWNSKDMKGKVLFVLGRILLIIVGLIVGLYLAHLILILIAGWFFS